MAMDEREGAVDKGKSGKTGDSQKGDVYDPLFFPSVKKEQGIRTLLGRGTWGRCQGGFPIKGLIRTFSENTFNY